jgi:hypothetical protein
LTISRRKVCWQWFRFCLRVGLKQNRRVRLAWRATSLNVIHDHCEFEIGLKRMIGPRWKPISSKGHHTHFCIQIERRSPANCSVTFVQKLRREFYIFFGGTWFWFHLRLSEWNWDRNDWTLGRPTRFCVEDGYLTT